MYKEYTMMITKNNETKKMPLLAKHNNEAMHLTGALAINENINVTKVVDEKGKIIVEN